MLLCAILILASVLTVFGGILPGGTGGTGRTSGIMPHLQPSVETGKLDGQGFDFSSGATVFTGKTGGSGFRQRLAKAARRTTEAAIDIQPVHAFIGAGEYLVSNVDCSKCYRGELCLLPHKTDCYKYVDCVESIDKSMGDYTAIARFCSPGTFFDAESRVCVWPGKAKCENDRCHRLNVSRYLHPVGNCKTHWECTTDPLTGSRFSKLSCCNKGSYFDTSTGDCEHDLFNRCDDPCPFLTTNTSCDATLWEKLPDLGCQVYWKCQNSNYIGTCCSDGFRYDSRAARESPCVRDETCSGMCPPGFDINDRCKNPNTKAYRVGNPEHCRSYAICSDSKAPQKCCPEGYYFSDNPNERGYCVRNNPGENHCDTWSNTSCLFGPSSECTLRPHFNGSGIDDHMYERLDHRDTRKGFNCPPGTKYDKEECGCYLLTAATKNCMLAYNFKLDGRKLNNEVGDNSFKAFPPEYINATAGGLFNGINGIEMDYFKGNELREFFVSLEYKIYQISHQGKVTLISTCNQAGQGNHSSGLDISYYTDRGLVLSAMNGDGATAELGFPFLQDDRSIWRKATVVYDGQNMKLEEWELSSDGTWDSLATPVKANFTGFPRKNGARPSIGGCKGSYEDTAVGDVEMRNVMTANCVPKEFTI